MSKPRILLVDDEDSIRFGMDNYLTASGYEVFTASSCAEARGVFEHASPHVAVLDYRLQDGTAIDLLRTFRDSDPDIPLVVLTAYGSIDLAVEAVKEGAEQFLTKPIEMATLRKILDRLLATRKLKRRQQLSDTQSARRQINPLAGDSPVIRKLADEVDKILGTDRPILILGETGTGKSLLAKHLHQHGPRADEPFVDLNCAGLMPHFLEAELFGHEKGAFTGAVAAKPGLLEMADGGTVFLDEIGDIDTQVQPKLLKALEDMRIRRMGAVHDRKVDIALIAATHHDLRARITEGAFRSDLYFRISNIPLRMPALRERRDDIALLAGDMLTRIAPAITFADDALQALRDYAWPGNIRELHNVLERAALLCDDHVITRKDLRFEPAAATPPTAAIDSDLTLREVERRHIERVLRETGGKVEEASRRLAIPRSTLYQKIKTYGITTH